MYNGLISNIKIKKRYLNCFIFELTSFNTACFLIFFTKHAAIYDKDDRFEVLQAHKTYDVIITLYSIYIYIWVIP